MRFVSSSSGCAEIQRTRIVCEAATCIVESPAVRRCAPKSWGSRAVAAIAALRIALFIVRSSRRSGLDRHPAALRPGRLLQRRIHLADDALLVLLVGFRVALGRAGTVRTTDVTREQRVARRHPQPWRCI